jgi:hypothetical protein
MNPVADLGTAPVVPSIEDAAAEPALAPEQGEQDALDQILDSVEENDDDDSDDDEDNSGLMAE